MRELNCLTQKNFRFVFLSLFKAQMWYVYREIFSQHYEQNCRHYFGTFKSSLLVLCLSALMNHERLLENAFKFLTPSIQLAKEII